MNTDFRRVIVVGTGNAALSAAISAVDSGAKVVVLEKASKDLWGGNSRLTTAALRIAFNDPSEVRPLLAAEFSDADWNAIDIENYPHKKYYEEVMSAGHNRPDEELVKWFTSQSFDIAMWLKKHGVEFDLAGYATVNDSKSKKAGKKRYPGGLVIQARGGGHGLVSYEREYLESKNVEFHFDLNCFDLIFSEVGDVRGVRARDRNGRVKHFYGSVVLGCGGFEASNARRAQFLGPEWDDIRQRCVKFNTGDMLMAAVRHGAGCRGHFTGAHITPIDIDSPYIGGLDTCERTNRLGFPWGITVDKIGHRFINEGKYWNIQTYVDVGRALLKVYDQVGFQVFDSQGIACCEPHYQLQKTCYKGSDLRQLAAEAGIHVNAFMKTIEEYNRACKHNTGKLDPAVLDGQSTKGICPPKTNWALPIVKPPYYIYPVVPGVTFSFGGLNSNYNCEILDNSDIPIPGLYGCGEITGGYFYYAYPTGSGLIKGAITGREAGKNAAEYVRKY
ncbi:FAD-dependent tricarballylate dehydrogenase TcuA [Lentisphaerota bacterium ZTH]|nr:FAD-dependent tricarballylate dehydrogenase TcuA [Lentisphaerota bacterium]WET07272.1 FAD-dependent tricarballylate dehydrogenase TcuA [Lentisphaerota bacterium ZTH]